MPVDFNLHPFTCNWINSVYLCQFRPCVLTWVLNNVAPDGADQHAALAEAVGLLSPGLPRTQTLGRAAACRRAAAALCMSTLLSGWGLPEASYWCSRSGRANAKSVSGQCGGQDPGSASDAVAQQPDGHIRFEFPLNRAHHVQGSPSQDAHDGGRVSRAHAAVVLPELHVQGAVQAVLNAPVAAAACARPSRPVSLPAR